MIRDCIDADLPAIHAIVNEAAKAYRGVIPDDCLHEPYMPLQELIDEIGSGVAFSGWEEGGELAGVMGLQRVGDVTLIRHAYVRTVSQAQGIGAKLLQALIDRTPGPLLVGTWAAATWAIRFYERHGFRLVGDVDRKNGLLDEHWTIPRRQRDVSVVLEYVR